MSEQWRPVVGFEGAYAVSDQGRVRSLDRILCDGRHWSGRILAQRAQDSGYLGVSLAHDGVVRSALVHRLVLEAFVGPCPEGMEACHSDDVHDHNQLSNLRWDTKPANAADQIANGRHAQKRKTQCPEGHDLAGANLLPSHARRGWRQCLSCNREHALAKAQGRPFDPNRAHERYRLITELEAAA